MGKTKTLLPDVLLTPEASLRECLSIMHKHGVQDVFVVDSDKKLVGVINEGMIRERLVDGAALEVRIGASIQPPAIIITPAYSRAEALDVMRALRLTIVPVIDHDGRVVGIHRDQSFVGRVSRRNWAVIMAGGRGTRLAPLTDELPKPMLQVAGRPILERLILHLAGSGIDRIFLSVNYLGHTIQDYFGDGSGFGCAIEYLWEAEDQPLGTGGPLGLFWELGYRPTTPLLVLNGDLVTGFAVGELLDAHDEHAAVATIAVSEYQHQVPFGVLEGDERRLARIVEKPVPSWPVNSGIYVIEPKLLQRVPVGELYPITELFEECLKRNEPVGLWPMNDPWQDIGRPSELARARGDV